MPESTTLKSKSPYCRQNGVYLSKGKSKAEAFAVSLVLEAMRTVPREKFVPHGLAVEAYDDTPLPIGSGQTISQPYIVAFMVEALGLVGGEKVLEIGAGSGYAAAVLAQIAGDVYTIERIGELAAQANENLARRGLPSCARASRRRHTRLGGAGAV